MSLAGFRKEEISRIQQHVINFHAVHQLLSRIPVRGRNDFASLTR